MTMEFFDKKLNILLAEDDEDDVLLIKELIRDGIDSPELNIDVVGSLDGIVSKLNIEDYDILLLDFRLGRDNGLDILRHLLKNEISLPVIVLTGQGDQEVAVEAMKSGATDYLSKVKLSVDILRQSIRHGIKLFEEEGQRLKVESTLRHQEKILQGVAEASNKLLTLHEHFASVNEALAILGRTLEMDRVCIFQHHLLPGSQKKGLINNYSWIKNGRIKGSDEFRKCLYSELGNPDWYDALSRGNAVSCNVEELAAASGEKVKNAGVRSLLLFPIIIDAVYWGAIGFFNYQSQRDWSSMEISTLKACAANFGGKIKEHLDRRSFQSIVEGTSSRVGDEFFKSLVYHLATAFPVKYSFIVEYLEYDPSFCRVIAGWEGDRFSACRQFSNLGDPCEEVMAGMLCYYPEKVSEFFPNSEFIVERKAESYSAVPFFDSSMKILGHLAVMDEKPLLDKQRTQDILKIFAGRAGAEMERKRAEDTIKNMAYYDSLTSLPNRVLLNDRISLAIANAERNKGKLAVLFLDFDRFKVINDLHGHAVGDQVLVEASRRLKGCLRDADTLARLGGDEFILLQPQIKNFQDSYRLAEKLKKVMSEPFEVGKLKLNITLSMGIAVYPDDGGDPKSLIKSADLAMYQAKEKGRNNYCLASNLEKSDA